MFRFSFLAVCILCSVCFANDLFGQNQVPLQNYGHWFMYFGDNKLTSRIGVHTELQLRNYFVNNTIEQTLVRVGLNYYVLPKVMLTAGYGFIYTAPTSGNVEDPITGEHRIWQQLLLRQSLNRISVEHRYRLEQRFIENYTSGKSNFENRLRYRLQVVLPLEILASYLSRINLVGYNELFLNLGKEVPAKIFDRNRLYGALAFDLNSRMNIQAGYLYQYIKVADKFSPIVNHNLQIAFIFNPLVGR